MVFKSPLLGSENRSNFNKDKVPSKTIYSNHISLFSMLIKMFMCHINPSLPESVMETCNVVLTFESVNEILWCDHSNETSSAVLLHGTICFSIFYKMKFGIFLGTLGG